MPAGYWLDWGGQFENLERASVRLGVIVPIVAIIIGALLVLALGSIAEAALVFACVPLALVGGALALLLRGMPFSISAAVGFIAVSGVATLNGLVLMQAIKARAGRGFATGAGGGVGDGSAAAGGSHHRARGDPRLRADGGGDRRGGGGSKAARHGGDRRADNGDAAHARRAADICSRDPSAAWGWFQQERSERVRRCGRSRSRVGVSVGMMIISSMPSCRP